MAAASSGGEANELIDEVARSEVNEMGDTMAAASNGGEASESIGEELMAPAARAPRSRGSRGRTGDKRRGKNGDDKRGE